MLKINLIYSHSSLSIKIPWESDDVCKQGKINKNPGKIIKVKNYWENLNKLPINQAYCKLVLNEFIPSQDVTSLIILYNNVIVIFYVQRRHTAGWHQRLEFYWITFRI